jgi:hypothetical protein
VQTFEGTDFSWIAVDAAERLGWFTINGFGAVPASIGDDPAELERQEDALGEWIRAAGRPFEVGAGDSMWLDAAAVGVSPSTLIEPRGSTASMAEPRTAVTRSELPVRMQEVLTLWIPDADFGRGVVSCDEVHAAVLLEAERWRPRRPG